MTIQAPPPFSDYGAMLLGHSRASELLALFQRRSGVGCCLKSSDHVILQSDDPAFEEQMMTHPYLEVLRSLRHEQVSEGMMLIFNLPFDSAATPKFLTESACLILALRLLSDRHQAELSVERQYREQFVQDLLYGRIHSEEELHNRSQLYGWDLTGAVTALAVSFSSASGHAVERLFPLAKGRMRLLFPDSVFSTSEAQISFLIPERAGRNIKRELSMASGALHKELASAYIGIGNRRESFLEASQSYQEALQSVKIAQTFMADRQLIFWDELGSYKLLSSLAENLDAKKFVAETLNPVWKDDPDNSSGLVETLEALSETNWNLKKASERLHVHYNTVKNRYKKLATLLDLDEEHGGRLFTLTLAVNLNKMMQITTK